MALQIGHRKSINIDLFGLIDTDNIMFPEELEKIGKLTVLKKSRNIRFLFTKIPRRFNFLVLRSLAYFNDADENEQPEMLIPVNRNEVKNFIENMFTDYIKN